VVIGVEVRARAGDRFDEVLTEEALQFVAGLQREFGGRRGDLLRAGRNARPGWTRESGRTSCRRRERP
jgi:malate synthase